MSRVQAPSVTPIFPLSEKHKKLNIRNASEPSINGLDRLFSRSGTGRDYGGQSCASLGFVCASRIFEFYKVTHLNTHLNKKTPWGHLPPSMCLFSKIFLALARFERLLTTRPRRAGGQGPKARQKIQNKWIKSQTKN